MDSPPLHQDSLQPDWSAHVRALRRLASSLLQGDDARDDVVQDTLLAALRRSPRVLSWTWLAAVMRHRAVDRSRRVSRRQHHEGQVEVRSASPSSEEIALRLEVHGDLNDAVRNLREPYQRVVYLRYFEDQTPAQIAATLGLPVKTVKTQLSRGLALLRERLERRHGADLHGLAILVPSWSAPCAVAGSAGILIMVNKFALVLFALIGLFGLWHWLRPAHPALPDAAVVAEARVALDSSGTSTVPVADPNDTTGRESAGTAADSAKDVTSARSGSLRVHVLWSDGSPASGVGVRLYGAESRRPVGGLAFLSSDPAGIALFEHVPGETVRVRADRGAESDPIAIADIATGTVRDVELRFAAGVQVRGRVVGPDGASVRHAEIHVASGNMDWLSMDCVARSDANGRFDLRDMPARHSIGATARGLGPSPLVDLENIPGQPPFQIELVLAAAGGDLSGRVVEPSGAPVPFAWVCVGVAQGMDMRNDGTFEEAAGPRSIACGADGTFRFDGLEPGTLPIRVCSSPFALWHSVVEIRAGVGREIRVELDRGAEISGIVRDERGLPVAEAWVRAFAAAVDTTFVTMGQYDDPDPFRSPVTRTDAQGRYRLAPVWSDEVHAYASPPRADDNDHAYREFHAEAVLRPKVGEVLPWNPVLSPGRSIHGRVTFADGSPMKPVFVSANPKEESRRLVVRTDSRGAFAFFNLDVEPFRIDVQIWNKPQGSAPLSRDDVWPDQGEIILVADFDDPEQGPKGRVSGSVLDADGNVPEGTGVNLIARSGVMNYAARYEGGQFLFDHAPKGEYTVVVFRGETAVLVSEPFHLAAGEERDVGTLQLAREVRLALRIERATEAIAEDTSFHLRRSGCPFGHMVEVGRRESVSIDRLTVGTYQLNWWGGEFARGERTIELERDADVVIRLSPGVTCGFDVHFPKAGAGRVLDIVVGVVGQETTYRERFDGEWNATSPFNAEIRVPAGAYAVTASTDTGLKASGELVVRTGEAAGPAVRLDLR